MRDDSFSPPPINSGLPPGATAPIAAVPTQIPGVMGRGMPRSVPWAMVGTIARGGGLLFLFLGTLIVVLFGSVPADCFTSTCTGNTAASVEYGILTGHLFWAIGAFGLIVGSGVRLRYVLGEPSSDGAETNSRFIAARRLEVLLLIVGIVLLLVITLDSTAILASPV